jgi:hypothetical protein
MQKKILLVFILMAGLAATARAGEDVDPLVQQNFEAKFGKTTDVKWEKIRNVYIGKFILNYQSMDCYYNDRGELLGTGRYFTSDKIDERTKAVINENFGGWLIQQAYEYTWANEMPQQMFILSNVKYTAIIRVNLFGSVEVIEKKKNKSLSNSLNPELSRIHVLAPASRM